MLIRFAALLMLGLSTLALAGPSVRFDVPAQPLVDAVRAVAAQSNTNIFLDADIQKRIAQRTSVVLNEDLTVDEALKRLLRGTGLGYRFTNEHTVLLEVQDGAVATEKRTWLRVAQTDAPHSDAATTAGTARGPSTAGAPVEAAQLEEIVVTAQKREERAFDVPISIAALGADELARRNINSVDDLQFAVPSLAIQSGAGARRIEIRGISNIGGGYLPLIGVYVDEADVTSGSSTQLDLSTYDLERVEVLRGPQGTLYGDGSAGGTIRFITRNPSLDRFSVALDTAALFTEAGAPGQRINAALNVPLIENELGLRIASTFEHDGGWIDQPAAGRKDINGQNLVDVRVKGLWKPTSQLTVSALAEIHRNMASTNAGEDASGNYTQVFDLTTTPEVVDRFGTYNLTLSYDFAAARILNTTTYLDQFRDTKNFGWSEPLSDAPGSVPFDVLQSFTYKVPALTDEFRAMSLGPGPWQWTVGAIYRHLKIDLESDAPGYYFGTPGPLPSTPFAVEQDTLSKSWAVFTDTSYRPVDRLTLGAGVRYFRDQQEFIGDPMAAAQSGSFSSVDPRAYAGLKLSDQVNLYASAAKGFRSGGFNGLAQPAYGPESVWTYELGSKLSFPGGRLYADGAVFYSDYTNYQISGTLPPPSVPLAITSNAGNALIRGIEWELKWRPTPQWSLGLNGDYLDTRFYKISAIDASHDVGDELDLVPKYMFTASAERDFSWYDKPGFFRLDYDQQGRETYRNRNLAGPTPFFHSESDVIHMLNLKLGLQWTDSLSLGLFVQNLTDDRGLTDPLSIQNIASRARPRTFGIDFSARLE